MKPSKTILGLALVAFAALGACGTETGGPQGEPADASVGTGRYLPLAVGSTWTWRVTDSAGVTYNKIGTVEALEDVGGAKAGTMAYRIRTKGSGGDTLSWQQDTGTAIVRHRDQDFHSDGSMKTDTIYTPFKMRIDESTAHVATGADYMLSFTEVATKIADGSTKTTQKGGDWTVVSVDEQLTVPAGTFTCLHLHKVGTDDTTAVKDYWFARGVGKIKESGGQTEELASYSLAKAE